MIALYSVQQDLIVPPKNNPLLLKETLLSAQSLS